MRGFGVIDAHQHFWNPGDIPGNWTVPAFGPADPKFLDHVVGPQLRAAEVESTVLIQTANSLEGNQALFEIAQNPASAVAGIVAWLPLSDSSLTERVIDELCQHSVVVGVRHLSTPQDDPEWVVGKEVLRSLELVASRGLTFDVVAQTVSQLRNVAAVAQRLPSLPIVIDHLAKPPVKEGGWEPWASLLAAAASFSNVFAKISGLTLALDRTSWTPQRLRPYIEHATGLFGPSRVMMGGDWPATLLEGTYASTWGIVRDTLAALSPSELETVLGGTARRFYGLLPAGEVPQRVDRAPALS
jgi:L-fuconolactonase